MGQQNLPTFFDLCSENNKYITRVYPIHTHPHTYVQNTKKWFIHTYFKKQIITIIIHSIFN